jgi:hypothetical protein
MASEPRGRLSAVRGQQDSVFGIAGIVWFALFLVYVLATSIHVARRAETALLA